MKRLLVTMILGTMMFALIGCAQEDISSSDTSNVNTEELAESTDEEMIDDIVNTEDMTEDIIAEVDDGEFINYVQQSFYLDGVDVPLIQVSDKPQVGDVFWIKVHDIFFVTDSEIASFVVTDAWNIFGPRIDMHYSELENIGFSIEFLEEAAENDSLDSFYLKVEYLQAGALDYYACETREEQAALIEEEYYYGIKLAEGKILEGFFTMK